MKTFGLFALALAISVTLLAAPTFAASSASVASQQQPPPLPEDAAAAYTDYFNEKDPEKKNQKAKDFLEKFASVDEYWKKGPRTYINNYELKKVYAKCQEGDKTFFGSPNEANLNNFISACDAWINKAATPDVYYNTRISLGTGYGVLAGFYKDTNRGMTYTEKSLELLASTTPPKDWKPEDWNNFRKENIGRLTQYQGLYKLRQTTPDNEAAVTFLTKAAAIKDGPAVKDPNTYLLRAEATTAIYTKLNAEYNALSDDDKRGDKGKELLGKIYPVVEQMANDYARVVALTEGQAAYKAIYDDAKAQCEAFVKFLNPKDGKPEDLYKMFKADVTAPDAKIKSEETASAPPPVAPTGKGGAKAMATTAGGGTPAGGSEAKTTKTTTKAKPAPVRKRK